MKTKSTLTLLLLILIKFVFCQSPLLNQFDSLGKKNGKWILYLDKTGAKLSDSLGASFCRYTYYDHGTHIYPMGNFISKNGKIVAAENNSNQYSKIKLLDGEYKCLDSKGRVKFIHVFKNGEYISYKEFYKSGKLHTFFDYTKHWQEQAHSWYWCVYNKKGKVQYEDYTKRDDHGHWPPMRG